ncbi:hypothetical protein GIB67_006062 [Kingdonia uniflora]|uniref:glutathione transferase n=1 Tax=Kingdonia uniflora TaxID=39325 RepID=A0A7J7LPV1_9MAGN|nr:hypothetical protein GIB67_006062 [Kingdonia uniflora]
MSKDEVILLDFWVSPFSIRAKIALAEKGVEFEAREEADLLNNKSELLLKSNPIHKKVPVLLHNGKAICESTVIVGYIDEAWPSPGLLPSCPYERSAARFWADYIDKKVYDAGFNIWKSKGEELKVVNKEFMEIVKVLEGVLGEKKFFGGDHFGFVDTILIPHTFWFYGYEQFGGFKVEDECPKFSAWMKRCMEKENVAKFIPDSTKVYEFLCAIKKVFGLE